MSQHPLLDLVPPYIEDYILAPPVAGQGVHQWVYGAAHKTYAHLESNEQIALLKWAVYRSGRPPQPGEVENAVEKVRLKHEHGADTPEAAWTPPEPELTDQLVMAGPRLAELQEELSPVRPLSDDPAYWLNVLFENDPLLCIAREVVRHILNKPPEIKRYWHTKYKSEWIKGNLNGYGLFVPNIAAATSGKTKEEGKPSTRCEEMFPLRTYLGIELDYSILSRDGTKETVWAPWVRKWSQSGRSVQDACAAVLWHLSQYGPMVMAHWSGKKSLHSLFRAHDSTPATLRQHMNYAVRLGADKATWSTCQLIRLPGGTRVENGNRQAVNYFNPENL